MPRKELMKHVKRIVVKIGTSSITDNGSISEKKMKKFCGDISHLVEGGYELIIVSSGAIATGAGVLNKKAKSHTIPEKQAFAAVGQTVLMNEYRDSFSAHGIHVGQLLLTDEDIKNRHRYLNARNTLNTLLKMKIIPIINENDSVAVKEIKFGDNDTLSAHVAGMADADLLVILSDVDGFYMDLKDPNPVEEIRSINDIIRDKAGGAGSMHGTGGMMTKIRAAEIIIRSGEKMIIANGNQPDILGRILSGENTGTIFYGHHSPLSSRKKWLSSTKARGRLVIDSGAVSALQVGKKSLLASGILESSGSFEMGDLVEIHDKSSNLIGKGMVNYNSIEIEKIMGKKSNEIIKILGSTFYNEVINRDDMIIF
jgi:glutamate 5-kinase